jgi:hypothetical protein
MYSRSFSLKRVRAARHLVWLALWGVAVISSAAPHAPDGYTVGTPWVGPAGIRERTADIMARQARQPAKGPRSYRVHRLGRVELVEYAETGVPASPSAGPAGPIPASAANAQSVGLSFLGATLADTLAYPPDSMGAVGPSQFIVAVNGRVRSFNKTTGIADGVINADSDVFFASVMTPTAVNFTSDPRIRYDRLSRRWFVIMIDVPNGTGASPNRVLIAVSDGPVITGGSSWTFYYFQHDLVSPAGDTGKFADYPTLGVDANALYIGVNVFKTRGQGFFDNTTAFVVRKSSLLTGGPVVVTAFRGLVGNGPNVGPYTPQGVDNYDPAATEGYFIGSGATGNFLYYDRLVLRRVSDPGGTPAISGNITVTLPVNTGGTIGVPALGTTLGTLDGLDYRLLGAHYRNGRLWTSSNLAVSSSGAPSTAAGARMGVRWYELQGIPTGQTPSVAQSGTLFDSSANARCFWMGTVMVSGQGHAAMGFSVAGANDRANAGTAGRLKNDAAGTMRTPLLYTATSAAYNPTDANGGFINRWGDYSYTCLDPDDDMTMWTIQEFCNANNSYGVQVAKLLAPPPATPASCNPAAVNQGAANVTVTLLGSSDGDTGFFDPGAGFSNRIAAAVGGGGVTVNSVTCNNPTNLTLNLTVAGAAAIGARTITVTNPDGQSAISATGILTILGAPASNQPPVLAAISNQTVIEETLLTFPLVASDPDAGQTLTFSFATPPPPGASLDATNGVFAWTPTEAQGPGTYPLALVATDNGSPSLSVTQTFTVFVLESNRAPTLEPIADRVVHAGSLIQFTNAAADADEPANVLTFSLQAGAPPAATVNPTNGVFTWPTTDADAGTTNPITVVVTDDGSPNLGASRAFTATVLNRPIIQSIAISNHVATLTWSAIAGQNYQLETNHDLARPLWGDAGASVPATGPAATATDLLDGTTRYYRVRVLP